MRDVEIHKKTYDKLSTDVEEARFAKAIQLGEVKVVSYAVQPKHAIKPKIGQNLVISGFLGLIMGIFIAFFQTFWENAVK